MEPNAISSAHADIPFNVLASTGVPVDYLTNSQWQYNSSQHHSTSPSNAFNPTSSNGVHPSQSDPPSTSDTDDSEASTPRQSSISSLEDIPPSWTDAPRPSFATNTFSRPSRMAPILGNPAMPNLLAGSVPRNVLRSTSGSAAPAPEIGWETLYTRQADIFKQEREVWEQERTLLRNEIERLKAQLASDHSKLGANGQLEDGEASDHVHRGHEFPHAAVEPSVGSHTPSSSPPGGRRSPMSRLPSISEDQDSAPVLKSLNGENHFPSIASAIEQGVDQVFKHERPLSPNPTPKHLSPAPKHLSPAPASYVKHAGHTPAKLGALSPSESLHSPLHNRHTRDNTDTNARSAEQLGYDIDDDPPLKGPLALPSTPEHPKAPAMLGELQNKLQEIEHDPDAHKPAVMQGRPAPLDESGTKQLASPSENKENEPVLNDDSHMAIKLRKKQSFNFGAPLGKLRP